MSNTPHYNAKIKAILNAAQPGERMCELTGEKWNLTEEELIWCRKFQVPPSGVCPQMRMKIIAGFAIGIEIWWNKHAETGAPILSYVHPDSPIKVLPDAEWHTKDFGSVNAEPAVDRSFIPQIIELIKRIPVPALRQFIPPVNTIGVSTLGAEDSYMVFAFRGKRSFYSYVSMDVEDSADMVFCRNIQHSTGLLRCFRMHSCHSAFESMDCLNSAFLFDCRNCEHCFGATNLRNKKYVFFNMQLSREEYEKHMAEIDPRSWASYQEYEARFHRLVEEDAIWPASFNVGSQESTGEYLIDCVRVKNGYWLSKANDSDHFWFNVEGGQDQFFTIGSSYSTNCFNCSGVVKSADSRCSTMLNGSVNVEYCYNVENCQDCFGCVGLKNKSFCILNKPYSEEEYWSLVDRIKTAMLNRGEYGEFFPALVSPAGFQFTSAVFMAGMTDQELGLVHAPTYDARRGSVVTNGQASAQIQTLQISALPDHLNDIDQATWIKKPILDPELNRPFSVMPNEFEMYQRLRLPFPRQHFTSRLKKLAGLANKPVMEESACTACQKTISVARNDAFPRRKIHCQSCYLEKLEKAG